MKILIEIVLFITAFIFVFQWIENPEGSFEPWIVFCLLILAFMEKEHIISYIIMKYSNNLKLRAIILKILGKKSYQSLIKMVQKEKHLHPPLIDNRAFFEYLEITSNKDHVILETIKSMRSNTEIKNNSYRSLLDKENLDVFETLSFINSNTISEAFIKTIPDPKLIIDCGNIKEDRFNLEFKPFNSPSFTIPDSPLLWPCNCGVNKFTVYDKVPDKECPVHFSEHTNDNITNLFQHELVEIQYDKVSILWKRSKDVWPPSVDAFNLVEDLRNSGLINENMHSVIDVGCGTGFLGIWLAHNYDNINDITFTDWLLSPLMVTAFNASRNLDNTLIKSTYLLGIGFNWANTKLIKEKKDLLICNPPYLPDLNSHSNDTIASTVFGTDLLEDTIRYGHDFAKEVIISFSDIAKIEAEESAKKWNKKLVPISKKHRIPFRVSHVSDEHEYIKELMHRGDKNDNSLHYTPFNTFTLHHAICTYRVLEN